jgi:Tol biopolymer transport system component
MDPDGFDPETILVGHGAICPFLTSDGKTLYFLSNQDDVVFNLWSYNMTEKTIHRITNYTDWNVGSPSLSMDGKRILFNLYRSNTTQVYSINSDGGDPVNLTNNNRSLCPRFAQNDRKIVYASYGTGDDISTNIFISNSNGTEAKSLTTLSGASPTWAAARILIAADVPTPTASAKKP